MSIFRKKVREFVPNTAGSDRESGFHYSLAPEGVFQQELYDALRANVPVIDACFGKIIRLTGYVLTIQSPSLVSMILLYLSPGTPTSVSSAVTA